MDRPTHKRRLQLQGFEEGEIVMAMTRVELYAEYNRTHPGFFDAFICTSRKRTLRIYPFSSLDCPWFA